MIPLRDNIPTRTFPLVNYALIAANLLVFALQLLSVDGGEALIQEYGVVPARSLSWVTGHPAGPYAAFLPLFTYMFLHGGFLHILFNCLYLWIFGVGVEAHFGHIRYAAFYVLVGIGSAIVHLLLNWSSSVPTIGASGAIAGVMGAYFVTYPRARVVTLVPILFFVQIMEIPAVVFLGLWILLQFVSLGWGAESGVAWWAHIGGFFIGIALLKMWKGSRGGRPPRGTRGGDRSKVIYIN